MTKFTINQRVYLQHEHGTKFYQLIEYARIEDGVTTRKVVVVHFGPMSSARSVPPRPVGGGQVQFKEGVVGDFFDSQMALKLKGKASGKYQIAWRAVEKDKPIQDQDDFYISTVKDLGAANAQRVCIELGIKIGDDGMPELTVSEPGPAYPATSRDDADIELIEERPDGWGSW